MKHKTIPLLIAGFVLLIHPVWASPPIPTKKSDALDFDQQLKEQRNEQKELKSKNKRIQKDLASTQKSLVDIAEDIQKNEKDLSRLDSKISTLEKEKTEIEDRLQKDRGSIANLILALERIRRVPPEALILKPDAPLKTAQSAMLLQNILPSIHEQAEALKTQLKGLKTVTADLQSQKAQLKKTQSSLANQQADLQKMVSARKKLYASTQTDLKEREHRIQKISSNAKNLKDLVQKLEKEKQDRTASYKKQNVALKAPSIRNVKPGAPRLPISGSVKTKYNQPDNFGAPSKGVDIEGVSGALVVAPMGGIIKFAGPFKSYGQMIIIEHQGSYHSLVAGLEKIDTVVGQKVSAGEPLGTLHRKRGREKPLLYFELRHKGKPINPARKFSEL